MKTRAVVVLTLVLALFLCIGAIFTLNQPQEGTNILTTFSQDKVKFCITGDTGKKSTIQKRIADIMRSEHCDRIIIVGDIIYPNGIKSINDPQIKTKFEDFYYPLTLVDRMPKVALINGNHDYKGNFRTWIELAKSKDWILMPNRYYMENVSGFCFYYLDSTMFTRAAYRWDVIPQIQWLRNTRQKNSKVCRTEIVLSHHPYLSVGRHSNASGLIKQLYDWLIIDKSEFLISGHAHLAKDFGVVGKTHLLLTGAGGSIEKGYHGGLLILELGLKDHTISYHFTSDAQANVASKK